MKLRLSNGRSFAVEFSAATAAEFRRAIRRAALEYFAHEGRDLPAQLHAATDGGDWLSANYPHRDGRHHYLVRFGDVDRASFADAAHSNDRGTWFEHELRLLGDWVKLP